MARFDRKRKKKTSNSEWTSPSDPDAKVAKMKDGRTHLAHKAEHAVDLESGALIAVTVQGADQGDTTTIVTTAITAAEQVEAAHVTTAVLGMVEEIVADKGYHSNETLVDLAAWVCGRISRNRTAADAIGPTRQTRKPPSIGIAAGSAALAGDACGGAARNWPRDLLRICMRRVGCDGRICAATTTS